MSEATPAYSANPADATVEHWLAAAAYYNGRHEARRRIEFQILLTVLAFYAGALGVLLGGKASIASWASAAGATIVLSAVGLVAVMHLLAVHRSNEVDMNAAAAAMRQARRRMGFSTRSWPCGSTGERCPTSAAMTTGSLRWQIGGMAILCAATTLAAWRSVPGGTYWSWLIVVTTALLGLRIYAREARVHSDHAPVKQ